MRTDLLLVNPFQWRLDPVELQHGEPYFPLGPLYLASRVRAAGRSVEIHDAMFSLGDAEFDAALRREPGLVGFYTIHTARRNAFRWIGRARAAGRLIVAGGPDASSDPDPYLRAGAHAVLVGEGEDAILELLDAADAAGYREPPAWANIQGARLAGADPAQPTPKRIRRRGLDELPFPAWDLLDLDAYRRIWNQRGHGLALSMIAGRGCPFHCTWCAKPVFDRTFTNRSVASVIAELQWLKQTFRPGHLRIVDDVFVMNRRWVKEFSQAVVEADAVIPFECLARVDLVDEEVLSWLHAAGCRKIYFGVESGSQDVLDAMRKGTTVGQARSTAALMHRLGMRMHAYLMFGYPGETAADIRKTIGLMEEAVPHSAGVSVTYPIPGTEFYESVRHDFIEENRWEHSNHNRPAFHARYPGWIYWVAERLILARLTLAQIRRRLVPWNEWPKAALKSAVLGPIFLASTWWLDRSMPPPPLARATPSR